ncbi:MAG: M48 family metalloprotease [Candidatus Kapabacteria bacterium]|nr:M48 family metalloprotease [Candidatus Kapabacteria bacterium]
MINRNYAVQALLVLLIPFAGMSLIHCGVNLFPIAEDARLGASLDAEIRNNPREYPVHNDANLREYVQGISNQLVQSPAVRYRGTFPYKVEIINDPRTLNAFCTPGGYIYVYTGLIKALDNEASLAAVMGHEIAHAERRHSTQRMTKAMGAQMMLQIALGQNPSKTTEIAANLFTGLALLKNSRDDESESDEYSFKYMQSTRWYPGALSYFFEKVNSNRGGAIERMLSTHPLPQDRIDACNERVRKANLPPPTEENLQTRTYQQIKSRL